VKGGTIILVVLILGMALCLVTSASYPFLQAKIMPMIVCGVILLLSIVELARDVSGRNKAPTPKRRALSDDDEEEVDRETGTAAYLKEGAWMVGFFLIIYAVGFIAGIAIFTTVYAGVRKTRWPIAVGMGVTMAVVSYILFAYLVNTELYAGIIPRAFGLIE
jgi:hypothetical protein